MAVALLIVGCFLAVAGAALISPAAVLLVVGGLLLAAGVDLTR